MAEQIFYTWGGSMTVKEAVYYLGVSHVAHIIGRPDYHAEIKRRVSGAWLANSGKLHSAYCTIMQAGRYAALLACGYDDLAIAETLDDNNTAELILSDAV